MRGWGALSSERASLSPRDAQHPEVDEVPSLGRSDGALEVFTVPSWTQNLSTETSLQHPLSPADRIPESRNSRIQLAWPPAPCLSPHGPSPAQLLLACIQQWEAHHLGGAAGEKVPLCTGMLPVLGSSSDGREAQLGWILPGAPVLWYMRDRSLAGPWMSGYQQGFRPDRS